MLCSPSIKLQVILFGNISSIIFASECLLLRQQLLSKNLGMTSATHFSKLDFVSLWFAHAQNVLTQPDMHPLQRVMYIFNCCYTYTSLLSKINLTKQEFYKKKQSQTLMNEIPPIQATTLLLCLSMITSNYHSEANPNEYISAKVDCFSKHNQFMPDDDKVVLFMMFTSYNRTQPTN